MKLLGICFIFCVLLLPKPTMSVDADQFEKEVAKYSSNLYKMCSTPFIDSILENEKNTTIRVEERFNDVKQECRQTYLMVASEEEAHHFCRSAMPLDVSEAKTNGTAVTCVWTNGANCPNGYVRIYDKCYIPKASCGPDDRLASPRSEDQIRWLSRMAVSLDFANQYPLVIKMTRVVSSRKVHEGKYFDGGALISPKSPSDLDNYKWAMVTVPNRIFGLKPGDIVRSNSDISLCERSAEGAVGSYEGRVEKTIHPMNPEIKEFGNGAMGSRGSIKLSKGRAFITRNDYLPNLLSDNSGVDHKYFHEVCRSICEKCVAASGDLLTEIGNSRSLPMGTYHVPVARQSSGNGGSDTCGGQKPGAMERKKFKALLGPDFQSKYTPRENEWFGKDYDKYPFYECSDGERFTVQFFQGNNEFGYVDAPVFDRKPLICYEGTLPEQPREEGACYKNSEMVNGKCQCKKDFEDGLDSNVKDILIKRRYTERGYICFKPVNCFRQAYKDMTYKGFFYLADGSGTMENHWHKVLPFAKMFKNWLSNEVPVWIMQWSSPWEYASHWWCGRPGSRYCPATHVKMLNPGWSHADYDRVAQEILGKWQNGWTLPYVFLDEVAKTWMKYKSDHALSPSDKALLIFVGDGEYQEPVASGGTYRDYHIKHTQLSWDNANVHFVGVNEASNSASFDHFNKYLNKGMPLQSIQIPRDGSRFDERLSNELLAIACTTRSEKDIIDAIG